ncbi:hypothetical protein [Desulfolithobacter sp.]
MSEAEWEQLTPEQKLELRRQEAELRAGEQRERLRAETEKTRIAAELEKARLQTWRELASGLGYGVFIRVNFLSGEGDFHRYSPIVPDSFLLPIGGSEKLRLRNRDGDELTLFAGYQPGKLILCSESFASYSDYDPRHCAILLDNRWEQGEEYHVEVPGRWDPKQTLLRKAVVWVKALKAQDCR